VLAPQHHHERVQPQPLQVQPRHAASSRSACVNAAATIFLRTTATHASAAVSQLSQACCTI